MIRDEVWSRLSGPGRRRRVARLYPDASVALEPVSEAAVAGEAAVPPELLGAAVAVRQWLAAPSGGLVLSNLPPVTGAPAVPVDLPFPLVAGLTPWASVRAEGSAGRSWHARALSPPVCRASRSICPAR